MSHKLRRTAASVAILAVIFTSSCSSSDSAGSSSDGNTATTAASGGDAASGDTVTISDFKFDPKDLQVKVGDTVTFTNEDGAKHTATSTGEVPKEFDTGDLSKGKSAKVTFDEAGTYTYYCDIHNYMKATVEVSK